MLLFSWAITPRIGWGSSVRAFWLQSRTLSQYHIKLPKSRQAVENDPNQTLQATVGEAFFLMFFGVSAGFGFSAADHKVVRRVIRQTPPRLNWFVR